VELLAQCKLSELPVLDSDERPIGLIDVTDLLAFVGSAAAGTPRSAAGVSNDGSMLTSTARLSAGAEGGLGLARLNAHVKVGTAVESAPAGDRTEVDENHLADACEVSGRCELGSRPELRVVLPHDADEPEAGA
jgi:hypothetical protein